MYADKITNAIERTMHVTQTRRAVQQTYNEKHGIIPRTIKRDISPLLELEEEVEYSTETKKDQLELKGAEHHYMTLDEVRAKIKECQQEMKAAAKELRFEDAAHFRDLLRKYQQIEVSLS